jgi:hypothetical protein
MATQWWWRHVDVRIRPRTAVSMSNGEATLASEFGTRKYRNHRPVLFALDPTYLFDLGE